MSEALEVTTFKLVHGLSLQDFLAANADIHPWLQRQAGFRWRRIGQRADGHVVDAVLWASVQDGQRAAAGIVTEMAHSPVHAAIDQSTVDWTICECAFSLPSPAPR